MAILKYWDADPADPTGDTGVWRRVGGHTLSAKTGFVPLSGGTITGALSVNSGDPWEAHIIARGAVQVETITAPASGAFDGNIMMALGKQANIGGAQATKVGWPEAAHSAVTKQYMDHVFTTLSNFQVASLGSGWTHYGYEYSQAGFRLDGTGNYCVLQGLVRTTTTITPSVTSPPIFILPEGYRPAGQEVILTIGNGDRLYTLDILAEGTVRVAWGPAIGTSGWLSLDGVRFPTT